MSDKMLRLDNGQSIAINRVPHLELEEFRECVLQSVETGAAVAAFFARPATPNRYQLLVVLEEPGQGRLALCASEVRAA